jgi:hypothetical protein
MALLKDRTLILMIGASSVIIFLMAIAFVMVVSVDGYGISPSPVISVSPNPAFYGQTITVWGQNFTPNKKAFLYQIIGDMNGNNSGSVKTDYTSNVDTNGNTTWIINEIIPYPGMTINATTIYAQDSSIVGNRSNTITLTLIADPCITPIPTLPNPTPMIPTISDMPTPPSPAFSMGMTVIVLITISIILLTTERSKKK